MRKLTQKDDIGALIRSQRLYYNGDGSPVMVKMVEYAYQADTWLIDTCGDGPRSLNSEGFYSCMLIVEEKDIAGLIGMEFQKMSNQIKEQMKKQEIELKEGMNARVEGGKVIIETSDTKFKAGDFVTCEKNEYGNKWIMIWDGFDAGITNEFCGYCANQKRLDIGSCSCSDTDTFRPSTEEERKILISALAEEGERWDAEKMQIVDVDWKPTDGEFVTQNTNWVSIYAGAGHISDAMSDYCGTRITDEKFTDIKPSNYRNAIDIRKSTPAEIQKFHALLSKSGKKWNPASKKVEDLEWKPKAGDVVTTISPRGKTISIYKSGNVGVGDIWQFYASIHFADGFLVDEKMEDRYGDGEIRLSNREERCTFFARMVAEGYKWNAKKLKLTKVEKWVPKDGEFVYMPETSKLYESIFIYKSGDNYYASMNKERCVAWVSSITCIDKPTRPATESERQQLADALAKAGKRWNAELKRVEDIKPEYEEGDFITRDDGAISIYKNKVNGRYFDHAYWGGTFIIINENAFANESTIMRLSTEEEKRKMISELYKVGKVWNISKKRIENIEAAPVEMTMEQVCEKLGMNVKIVKK